MSSSWLNPLKLLASNASAGEIVNHVALAFLKYNPVTLGAQGLYKMGAALVEGNYEALRNEAYNMLAMFGTMRMGETPAAKRELQLKIKQVEFLQQQMRRSVIEETPLTSLKNQVANTREYVVESARRDANGVPVLQGRVTAIETHARASDGMIKVAENGEVTYKACFVAGTLVHTPQGLVPIESVRAASLVLSQPEGGGSRDERRVVETMAHLDQQVYAVQVKPAGEDTLMTLIATPNHPFWVEHPWVHGKHWMTTECLEPGFTLQLIDGRKASVHAVGLVRHTQHAHLGFATDDRAGVGVVLALRDGKILPAEDQVLNGERLEIRDPVLTPVYNFEVEEFHTYYVGEFGVWVHNTECGKAEALEFAARKAERDEQRPTCFPADTYVVARDNQWIEIDRLGVGDWVLSRCEKTGRQDYRRVTKKFEHCRESWDAAETPLYSIEFVTCEGEKHGLYATAEHPFWVNGIGWVKACELKPGNQLEICDPIATDNSGRPEGTKSFDLSLSGQRWQAEVLSVVQEISSGIVFNIEVEEFHTYFIGPYGVWVHNKNEGESGVRGQGEPAFTQELIVTNAEGRASAGKSDVNRRVEKAGDSPENRNAARGENESADMLAKHDQLEVVQLPSKNTLGKDGKSNPDLLMDGRTADIYTPQKEC